MKELSQSQVILDYERPVVEPVDGRAYLKRMRFWRSVTGGCLLLSLFGFLNVLLAIAPVVGAIVAAVLTLKYLWLAAYIEAGAGYATRHLVLAIILLPWGFFGIFLVPILLESDMLKWHAEEDREAAKVLQDRFQD